MSNNLLADKAIGFGTMSLCITDDRPTEAESVRMIETLIDEDGLRFIDTADAYCLGEEEFGYGERIVAKFMGRDDVTIATKGGFTRPNGAWKRCGDPAYLRSACEASLMRLGVSQIGLYQFHVPDPEVPFEESFGEVVRLQAEGKVEHVGVSNVTLEQLRSAKQMADVRSVQNSLGFIYYERDQHDPILRFCEANNIAYIAYAPLSGHRNPYLIETLSPRFNQVAERMSLTPYQLALLALRALSPVIIPIPGSKSKQHVMENLATKNLTLSPEVLQEIDTILEEESQKKEEKKTA